jgi:SAM-dependent methyltransferase
LNKLITQPYKIFSKVYDEVMNHIDFNEWANFILNSVIPFKIEKVLDLGCGTGSILRFFPDSIHKVGLDASIEMLNIAKSHDRKSNYVLGNIQNFSIGKDFDLVICTHDTLNYLESLYDLEDHFQSVNSALKPGGYYFFDISSEYNLQENFHNRTFKEKHNGINIVWKNKYEAFKKQIISTLQFEFEENDSLQFHEEVHIQNFFSNIDVMRIFKSKGFEVIKMGSDYKSWNYKRDTSLINFLVKKK